MVRGALGIVVGGVVWMTAFFLLAWPLAFLWPDYALHAQTYMNTGAFHFTPSMSVFNVLF